MSDLTSLPFRHPVSRFDDCTLVKVSPSEIITTDGSFQVLATDMSRHLDHLAHLKTMVETRKISGNCEINMENYCERIQVCLRNHDRWQNFLIKLSTGIARGGVWGAGDPLPPPGRMPSKFVQFAGLTYPAVTRIKCARIYHFQTKELRNFLGRGLTPTQTPPL